MYLFYVAMQADDNIAYLFLFRATLCIQVLAIKELGQHQTAPRQCHTLLCLTSEREREIIPSTSCARSSSGTSSSWLFWITKAGLWSVHNAARCTCCICCAIQFWIQTLCNALQCIISKTLMASANLPPQSWAPITLWINERSAKDIHQYLKLDEQIAKDIC